MFELLDIFSCDQREGDSGPIDKEKEEGQEEEQWSTGRGPSCTGKHVIISSQPARSCYGNAKSL